MSASRRAITIRAPVERFLWSRDTCRIATVAADGYPHCVPVGFVYHHGLVYMPTNSTSRKAYNIRNYPKCCVLVDLERKRGAKGVMLAGRAKVVTGKSFARLKSVVESVSGWHLDEWELGPKPRDRVDAFIVFAPEKSSVIGRARRSL
jgi:nitroimidazol reductase NimA-like FMN-containing flavoprotein (pyridoxamine 5'-phosphate oxidase superfamily)